VRRCTIPNGPTLLRALSRLTEMSDEQSIAWAVAICLKEQLEPLQQRIAQLEQQVKLLKDTGVNYRGVFEDGERYEIGDACTSGGSMWRAYEPTTSKPGSDLAWRLIVKRGRNGKDAMNGQHHHT
jgi:hypothetical protein